MIGLIQEIDHDAIPGGRVRGDICHKLSPICDPAIWVVLDSWVLRMVVNQDVKVIPGQKLQAGYLN